LIRGLEDPAQRAVLSRLVTFKTGAAVIDGATSVPAREITIAEVFRRGSIKISRTRAWPQFAAMVPPATRAILEAEAESQYHNEHLTWIDVERVPAESEEQQSTAFANAAARGALRAFQAQYRQLLTASHPTATARIAPELSLR